MRALAAVSLIAFCMVLTIFAVGLWSCEHPIKNNSESQHYEQSATKDCATLHGTFVVGLFNFGRSVRAFNAEITALSTVVVAIFTIILGVFTISLARSTRTAADAAVLNAMAAINADRPFVHLEEIGLRPIPLPDHVKDEHFQAFFKFVNYGRTPAFVTNVGYGQALIDRLPTIPEYRGLARDFPDGVIIRPGDPFEFQIPFIIFTITAEQRKAIKEHKIRPWLWGVIRYRDFMGGEAENGFAGFQYPEEEVGNIVFRKAEFNIRGPEGFIPEAYTYQRYRPASSADSASHAAD